MTTGLLIEGLVINRREQQSSFILDQDYLEISPGEAVGLFGPSGCGKSTLLDIVALVLRPTRLDRLAIRDKAGNLVELARSLLTGSADQLAYQRSRLIGYVLQTGGILSFATVGENIELPRRLLGMRKSGIVASLARRLDISDLLHRRPERLSVGQRQRVAVARALSHEPPLIIADEPTASLDPVTGDATMELLISTCRDYGATLIVSTHDQERARQFGLTPVVFSPRNCHSRFERNGAWGDQ